MKKFKNYNLNLHRGLSVMFLGVFFALFLFLSDVKSAPLLANYYLANLTGGNEQVEALAKYDCLVLTPAQIYAHQAQVKAIRRKNPEIIILAYVPSQSYNTRYNPNDPIFKQLKVPESAWLYSSTGKQVTFWADLKMVNMSKEWSDYYVSFIENKILTLPQMDGIFLDMVDGGISGLNKGDVDINGDGLRDSAKYVDTEWVKRVTYFLEKMSKSIKAKYVVINGSSVSSYQSHVNGRMYETFPTPWEQGGDWSKILTGLEKNQKLNLNSKLSIFNSNTGNTGNDKDYKKMRFGLGSSLLLDNIYFSYDYGDQSHGQLWWYDEYGIDLGSSVGIAESKNSNFEEGLWWREFDRGIAIVNSGTSVEKIELGAEYEKLLGTQDTKVNDGSIVDSVNIPSKDGILMLKTTQAVSDIPFKNGDFLRFYDSYGSRVRNAYFAYDGDYLGGTKVFRGNIDGKPGQELILIKGYKMEIFNSEGGKWFSYYPFGGGFRGDINIVLGSLYGASVDQIVIAPSYGNEVILLNYHGKILKNKFYPLGKEYNQGFTVAIGNVDQSDFWGEVVLGTGDGKVMVFDYNLNKLKKTFYPFGKSFRGNIEVAVGKIDGSKYEKIIVTDKLGKKSVKIIDYNDGSETEFLPSQFPMGKYRALYSTDVNFDSRDEVVLLERD